MLGDLYAHKASNAKIEKLFAKQVKEKLREISLDLQIQSSFNAINQRIQDRLNRLKQTKFEIPDIEEDKENKRP